MKHRLPLYHGIIMIPRCRFFDSILSLFVLLSANKTAVIQAQATCEARQTISAPMSITPASATVSAYVSSYTFCQNAPLSGSSSFPAGRWYSYTPSKAAVTRMHIAAASENSFHVAILKGSCGSLTCVADSFFFDDEIVFQGEIGVEYFIYYYVSDAPSPFVPFTLFFNELAPPANDKMENAIAWTNQDLPIDGTFQLGGALSDFKEDACGLSAKNGVWFTYTTTYFRETLVIRADTGSFGNRVGIQTQNGSRFDCMKFGTGNRQEIVWTAQGNTKYYILVTDYPVSSEPFTISMQSRNIEEGPSGGSGGAFSGICN